jgi:hypothetical protein
MVTPDCLASFAQGVKEIGGAVGNTAGQVIGSTAGGVVKGAVEGVLNPQGTVTQAVFGNTNWPLYAGLGLIAVAGVFLVARGR